MRLARLQHEFQRHVLCGDEQIAQHVTATTEVPAHVRLGVYSHAYRSRLTEALASNMPRLKQLVGEQAFGELALRYIEQNPSRYASIRWFGDALARMLRDSQANEPWLAELAEWEWSIAAAFDAADQDCVGPDALAHVAPEDWGALQLAFHASAIHLRMATNAPALFKALAEDRAPPQPAMLDGPQSWLIWRQQLTTKYRSMSAAEAAAFDLAREGGTFGAICQQLCEWHEPADVPGQAAGILKQWLMEEIVAHAATGR